MSSALNPVLCKLNEIYIECGSDAFDLHNDFDFVGFTYDTVQRVLSLRWTSGECYSGGERRRALVLELGGVSHLSSTPRDPELPFSEDSCLHQMGRIPPDAPMLDSAQSEAPLDWHYVFSFQSGFMLRIAAESVSLRTDDI